MALAETMVAERLAGAGPVFSRYVVGPAQPATPPTM